MAVDIWLEHLTVVSMGLDKTPRQCIKEGSFVLQTEEIVELNKILHWLNENNIMFMAFWDWKIFSGEEREYVKLCPRLMFFEEADAVHFKMVWK
jgi:hypothetical protein